MLYCADNKQLYCFKGKITRGETWRCIERKNKCNARVIIDQETGQCIRLTSFPPYNHESNNEQRYINSKAINAVIEKCASQNALPSGPGLAKISDIFTSVMAEHQDADIQFREKYERFTVWDMELDRPIPDLNNT